MTKCPVLVIGNFSPENNRVSAELAEQLSRGGRRVYTTSEHPGRVMRVVEMLQDVWRRRRQYAAAQVDVYSGPAFVWAEMTCWALRRLGKPYVLTLHGGALPDFARRWPGRVRRLLQSAAGVTAPSSYLQEQMRPYHSELLMLPNARDLRAYPFRLREEPQPRLVWLRRFHRVYNPSLAPKVLACLLPDAPGLHLTMVGPDSGDGSLEETRQEVAARGVADRLTLTGAVSKEEVPLWLERGDIFLNTTYQDNTPLSVLEAMACGLAIVSTNVGGLAYLLEHDRDALLVPPDDPQAMAAAVRRILTEPGLAERLSRNARRKAERFDWSVVLPQWESLLTRVVEGR